VAKTVAKEKSVRPTGERRGDARARVSAATLDRLIHERMRLAIVAELAVAPTLSFTELRQRLGTTDGNLSVHARRLEEAGYIGSRKSIDRRSQRTDYWLTPAGRAALTRYLDQMKALIATLRVR
jgi:DNA-binding MarR family transcriptional regulator